MQIKTKSLALLFLASLLLVSACTIQLRVKIDLAEDGSGQITAGIGLDEQARNQPAFQNIEEALRISDLIEAGWEFESAGLGSDGREWFESAKSFADPDDLQKVLNELTNSPEAFKDWKFSSEITSKTRDFAVSGVVDLTDGLNLFTDESLNKLLDEPPLGIAIQTIEEALGTPINETISLQVIINLPDQSNEEIIDIPLGEERVVEVTGNSEHRVAQILDWVVLAVLALLALSIILAILNWYLDKRYEQRQLQRRPSPVAQQIPGNEISVHQQSSTQTERLQLLVIDPHTIIFKEENTPLEYLRAFINKKEGNSHPDELLDLHRSGTMGNLTASEFWNQVGLTERPDSLNREYVKSLQFRSGGKDFLKNLHKRGIAVSVVTNDFTEWSTQICEIYGLQGIHPWIISSDYGVRKPDAAILEILNRSSGIAYQSCLVLDTATNFLDTAQTLGMKTVHFNPEANKSDANQNHPSVRRLNEFFKGQ